MPKLGPRNPTGTDTGRRDAEWRPRWRGAGGTPPRTTPRGPGQRRHLGRKPRNERSLSGVGGIIGSLLVAFLALPGFGGLGLAEGVSAGAQFIVQFKSVAITVVWTAVASAIILMVARAIVGLRVDEQT
ncbi:MAG: hypothetical protein VW830_13550 [Rhodobiaceae bacterium]